MLMPGSKPHFSFRTLIENLNKHKLNWRHLVEMLNKSWERGRSGGQSVDENSGKLLDQIALIRP